MSISEKGGKVVLNIEELLPLLLLGDTWEEKGCLKPLKMMHLAP